MIGLLCLFIAFKQYRQNQGLWKIRFFVLLGSLSLLTSPWLGSIHKAVIGAYPTIDKEGSLLFFEHGVHHLWFTSPDLPLDETGLTLVGIHVGHLWLTECFSIFAPTFVAFNVQAFTHLLLNTLAILYWVDGYKWIRAQEWEKWVVALLLGAQLHVFRDIHWYTIEKSALFPLFLFWGTLSRQRDGQGNWQLPLMYLLACLYNFYWAILCPLLVITEYNHLPSAFIERTRLAKGLVICCGIGLVMAILQMTLQTSLHQVATPEKYASRAALDVLSLWPVDWNRMGIWRPINLVLLGMGMSYIRELKSGEQRIPNAKGLIVCSIFGLILSLGPFIAPSVPNPIYSIFQLIPGMWRFAKPEIFCLIPYAIVGLLALRKPWPKWIWAVAFAMYIVGLYTSVAFPYLTEFIEGKLHF